MSVDQVSIVNNALTHLGADRISAITQNTRSAVLAKAVYDQLRDSVQAAHPWVFTKKVTTLAPTGTTPEHTYNYQYDYPNDFLTLWEVIPDDIVYEATQDGIMTDETSIDVVYGARNTNESSWDPMFCDALSWKLAEQLCYSLTQSLALKGYCQSQYMKKLQEAEWRDSLQDRQRSLEADGWLRARK